METVSSQAKDAQERHERIVLTERDFARFVEMIENPEPPTRQLQEAMAEFQRLQAAHPEANL